MKTLCVLLLVVVSASAYTFTKCSLASTLVSAGVARGDVHKWVCMANAESGLRTTAHNVNRDGSADHGIFQINDYWNCDPRNGRKTKNGCKHPCTDFENSSLSDDVRCMKTLLGWQHHDMAKVSYGYAARCKGVTASYLSGCSY
ncbi:hypothetical protein LOTGIDRAFT_231116 [Lottia gigantea]|uniref:lysozyme n=1 Tax=Lottia gigantea TaxID=225164 RepID=V4AQL2_LOTGI|nr:hypothetical protein LOTGIDRAFT_231116 [Lottia gigantea]ESO99527.1 hypothetical protein LOTGIDRAFT_231116 [Lottia gigantea]